MMCDFCNDTGLVGPADDRYVCPCSIGRSLSDHWKMNYKTGQYELQVESHLANFEDSHNV